LLSWRQSRQSRRAVRLLPGPSRRPASGRQAPPRATGRFYRWLGV